MKRKVIKSFKRFLAGTLAFVTAVSIVSGYPLSVSAEERVPTGTDLDNFDISLNWGDKSEGLSDAYELYNENSENTTVKMQLTIEYTGDGTTTYQPEELSIELSDFMDIYQLSKDSSYFTVDVGAELKGSGSGRGDWYYTKTFNSQTKKNNYVLTNKNIINTAFTSTIQFVFDLSDVRRIKEFSVPKYINANMIHEDISFSSNQLEFVYKGLRDEYTLELDSEFRKLDNNDKDILNSIPDAEWDDYIYGYFFYDIPKVKNSIGLKKVIQLITEVPDDIYTWIKGYTSWQKQDERTYTYKYSTDYADGFSSFKGLPVIFAMPKSKYENIDSLEISASLYGTYSDSDSQELLSTDTEYISLSTVKDDYFLNLFGNISTSFFANATGTLYKEALQNNIQSYIADTSISKSFDATFIKNQLYNTVVSSSLNDMYYRFNDSSTVVNKSYRKIDRGEVSFKSIQLTSQSSSDIKEFEYEIYGKANGSSESEKITEGVVNTAKLNIDISDITQKDIYEISFKFKNITEPTNGFAGYTVRFSYNLFNQTGLNNEKDIDGLYAVYYGYIEDIDTDGNITKVRPSSTKPSLPQGLDSQIWSDASLNGKSSDARFIVETSVKSINYTSSFNFEKVTLSSSEYVKNDRVYVKFKADNSSKWTIINSSKTNSQLINGFAVKVTYDSAQSLEADSTSSPNAWTPAYLGYELTYSDEIDNGDGTKSRLIYYNTDGYRKFTDGLQYPYINLTFSVSLDDYYLLNYANRGYDFKYELVDCNIYNEMSEQNYVCTFKNQKNYQFPKIANNTYQGIETEVSTDAKPDYTKAKIKVNLDGTYSYKLKASAGETQMANIVLYDNIENVEGCAWRGTFAGVSFEKLQQAGVDISKFKTYYSTNRNQSCSLDTDGWILSNDYTGKLGDVKSVAVDMQGYVLGTKQRMYVEILMKSPKDGVLGSTTLNQYNASYQEFDDGDINLTTPLKTTTNLPSNTTEVALGDVMTNISVVKIWNDSNDKLHYRPDNITGKILQNGAVYDTFVLSKDNKWTAQITARMYDDSDAAYEYTVEEDVVDNYTAAITKTADEMNNYGFTITNSLSSDLYTEISGTKTWDDNDDEYGIRPDSITVNLYQNDVKIDTTTSDSSKNWKYTFGILDKYDSEGNKYVYTVKEEEVDGYTTEYIEPENGVQVHFNSSFKTESVNYDYVEIYYQLDGKMYKLGKWGGTSLADKTVEIPSTDFYVYWKTDSSGNNYYGFAIDSVVSATVKVPTSQTAVTLPSVSNGVYVECTGTNYPESEHSPYSNNLTQGWHYAADVNCFDITNHLVRYQDLHITKFIPLSDILAEHGAPSFIFKAEGSNGHTYYQTITFDENSDYGIYEENGIKYAILSTTFFDIEEDIYTVSEIGVSRFNLQEITDISENATISEDTVIVDLTKGYGFATFVNAKTKWNNFSHKDIRVNEIHLEPKKPV